MANLTTARERVAEHLRQMETRLNAFGSALPVNRDRPQQRLVVVKEYEYEFGWVFCYNTQEFVETGDADHALGGNAPLIVDRVDGCLYGTGTAHSLDHYLSEFQAGIRRPA